MCDAKPDILLSLSQILSERRETFYNISHCNKFTKNTINLYFYNLSEFKSMKNETEIQINRLYKIGTSF